MPNYNPLAIRTQLSPKYSHALPTVIKDYYKYSFYPRTITAWNKLPRKIESNSLAAFKNAISNIY